MLRYLSTLLLSAASVVAIVIVSIWLADPMFFFRYPGYFKPRFYPEIERFQNIGLARNFNYDTVIIGTSMAENFSIRQIEKELGWKAVNLSISGSSAYEQGRLLRYAIKKGHVRRVIWLTQWDSFDHPVKFVRPDAVFPDGVLDDDLSEQFKYYLGNVKTLKWATKRVFALGGETDVDRAWNWNDAATFGCGSIRNEYDKIEARNRIVRSANNGSALVNADTMRANINENLFDLIQQNPGIDFHLITPPYSIWSYKWAESIDPKSLTSIANFREMLARMAAGRANVHLMDFQSDTQIIYNPAFYKDLEHYSEAINQLMVHDIAAGKQERFKNESEFLQAISGPVGCTR